MRVDEEGGQDEIKEREGWEARQARRKKELSPLVPEGS
jgi:hypothetical protein